LTSKTHERDKALATNELLNFGDAIQNFGTSNSDWTKQQVHKIKTDDAGNRSGAIFELLGLNLFHSAGYNVIASKANNPGYDGTVILSDGAE
jgi:hypothetical protein